MRMPQNLVDQVRTMCLNSLNNHSCGQYFSDSIFESKIQQLYANGERSTSGLADSIVDQIILESPPIITIDDDEDDF